MSSTKKIDYKEFLESFQVRTFGRKPSGKSKVKLGTVWRKSGILGYTKQKGGQEL